MSQFFPNYSYPNCQSRCNNGFTYFHWSYAFIPFRFFVGPAQICNDRILHAATRVSSVPTSNVLQFHSRLTIAAYRLPNASVQMQLVRWAVYLSQGVVRRFVIGGSNSAFDRLIGSDWRGRPLCHRRDGSFPGLVRLSNAGSHFGKI